MDAIIQVATVLMDRDYADEALWTPASLGFADLSAEELGRLYVAPFAARMPLPQFAVITVWVSS